jgi:two-component system response regulator YesN
MYRILIADDEGIMLEALTSIILGTFGNVCELETAKSGRAVIEKAEVFRPDIVFMDIHMPGINGIQAMKEIRSLNKNILFYVISAYDTFDYAKDAIDLGVEKYLTKPISRKTVISLVEDATKKVDNQRRMRSDLLKIQEKLETIIPAVECGFVNNMLFQNEMQDSNDYRQLLDIEEKYGYVCVVQFGQDYENGKLVSPVGIQVRAQAFYPEFREIVKTCSNCVIGPVMSDRIVLVVPHQSEIVDYEERIQIVEKARMLSERLEKKLGVKFRIAIGRNRPMEELEKSYHDAIRSLNDSISRVIHTEDRQKNGIYDGAFPEENERRIFRYLKEGNVDKMLEELTGFFSWMVVHYSDQKNNIRLKVLEYIIWAERIAFDTGAINYGFSYRKDYLDIALSFSDYEDLERWFREKMASICRSIADRKEEQSDSVANKAKDYIQTHFQEDVSLDDVSREVNMSPYYFSKVFKEKSGENFIEYLTRVRIDKAKEMLQKQGCSIKEASALSGYSDPNYFSKLFKKQTDMTPREYKTRYGK